MKYLINAIQTIPGKGAVLITSTEGDQIEIPFSWFKATPVCAPNFDDLEVVDDGLTLRLGNYEVLAEVAIKANR